MKLQSLKLFLAIGVFLLASTPHAHGMTDSPSTAPLAGPIRGSSPIPSSSSCPDLTAYRPSTYTLLSISPWYNPKVSQNCPIAAIEIADYQSNKTIVFFDFEGLEIKKTESPYAIGFDINKIFNNLAGECLDIDYGSSNNPRSLHGVGLWRNCRTPSCSRSCTSPSQSSQHNTVYTVDEVANDDEEYAPTKEEIEHLEKEVLSLFEQHLKSK